MSSSPLTLRVNWTEGKEHFRSNVIGGMQIEIFTRDEASRTYGFSQKWQYKLWNWQGQEICWGLSHTKTGIKNVALTALKKRLVRD